MTNANPNPAFESVTDCWILYSKSESRADTAALGSWVMHDFGNGMGLVLERSVDPEDVAIAHWDLTVYRCDNGEALEGDEVSAEVARQMRLMLVEFMASKMPWRRWPWSRKQAEKAVDAGHWNAIEAWLSIDLGLMVGYDERFF